jgi:hypothetical protein
MVIMPLPMCAHCGVKPVPSARATYCSGGHAQAARRARERSGKVAQLPTPLPDGPASMSTEALVRADLEVGDRLATPLGGMAMQLARRVDQATAVMGYAALVKQLMATLDAAMRGVAVRTDAVDDLKARRDAKRAAG